MSVRHIAKLVNELLSSGREFNKGISPANIIANSKFAGSTTKDDKVITYRFNILDKTLHVVVNQEKEKIMFQPKELNKLNRENIDYMLKSFMMKNFMKITA